MAEESLIYGRIRIFFLPSSLLPITLSHSCSSSRLRESVKSSIEAFGFLNERCPFQIEKFQEKILVFFKEMKKTNFWRVVLPLCKATFKNRWSNTNSCFLVPLGSYSNTGDSLRKGKHWKKNKTKPWTNLHFNTFYCAYWQEEENWQISIMKILFPPTEHYALKCMCTSCFIF